MILKIFPIDTENKRCKNGKQRDTRIFIQTGLADKSARWR